MQFKIKYYQVIEYLQEIEQAFPIDYQSSQFLPIKISYVISKNRLILRKLSKEIENVRDEIIKKYGTVSNDNPSIYTISEETNQEKANLEFQDFLNTEVNIQFHMLDIDSINEDINISTTQMNALCKMLYSGSAIKQQCVEEIEKAIKED